MVVLDKIIQVGGAKVVLFGAKCVFQIKLVNAKLVGHHHIGIVRHPARHPVMAADGFQPPDLVDVLERNAVHLVSAVFFQQLAQPQHALARSVDVRQYQINNVLLANAAGNFWLTVLGGDILHQRVSPQNAGVGSDGLGGGHADTGLVHAACGPDALALHGVGHCGHPHRAAGQLHFHMGKYRPVHGRVLLRGNDHELFGGEMPGTGIVIAGNHGRAIIRSFSANQNCCTSHIRMQVLSVCCVPENPARRK